MMPLNCIHRAFPLWTQRLSVMVVLIAGLACRAFNAGAQRESDEGAFPQTVAQPPPIRAVDGPYIFRNYCAPCHGINGRGKGPVSKALRQSVPDLTRLSRRNGGDFPSEHVRKTIMFGDNTLIPAHGSRAMPIWGPAFHEIDFDQDLGNVRLENVSEYLRSIQRKRRK